MLTYWPASASFSTLQLLITQVEAIMPAWSRTSSPHQHNTATAPKHWSLNNGLALLPGPHRTKLPNFEVWNDLCVKLDIITSKLDGRFNRTILFFSAKTDLVIRAKISINYEMSMVTNISIYRSSQALLLGNTYHRRRPTWMHEYRECGAHLGAWWQQLIVF